AAFANIVAIALCGVVLSACEKRAGNQQRRQIGEACNYNEECGDSPPYVCLHQTVECGFAYGCHYLPGGYCSRKGCVWDYECPPEAVCEQVECTFLCLDGQRYHGYCRRSCNSSAECRPGYFCNTRVSATHCYCDVEPPAYDAGTAD